MQDKRKDLEKYLQTLQAEDLIAFGKQHDESSYDNLLVDIVKHLGGTAEVYHIFKRVSGLAFQQLQLPAGMRNKSFEDFAIRILQNRTLSTKDIAWIMRAWVICYLDALAAQKENIGINDLFYRCLPKTSEGQILVLSTLVSRYVSTSENTGLIPEVVQSFLTHHLLKEQDILNVIGDPSTSALPLDVLIILLKRFNLKQSKYQHLQKVVDFMALPIAERGKYVCQHSRFLSERQLGSNLHSSIWMSLTGENRRELIIWYIDHPKFEFGEKIKEVFCDYGEVILHRYLQANHTLLPSESLYSIVEKVESSDPHELIQTLLTRTNYTLQIRSVVKSLFVLFNRGHLKTIKVLLDHASVFALLKQYHKLAGDDCLPSLDRGTLLPTVIAWYIKHDKNYLELFHSVPKISCNEILKTNVHCSVDEKQRILRVYIIASGRMDIIKEVGDIAPRFVKMDINNSLTVYMPKLWENPRVQRSLHPIQQKFAIRFVERISSHVKFNIIPTEIQEIAKTIVMVNEFKKLELVHQTHLDNFEAISEAGKIQSRFHIEEHPIHGTKSRGLDERRNINWDSAFCYFTRKSVNPVINSGLTVFNDIQKIASVTVNFERFLKANRFVNFCIVSPYPYSNVRKLKISEDYVFSYNPSSIKKRATIYKIEFNQKNALKEIYQRLMELVLVLIIPNIPEPHRASVLKRLQSPQNKQDHQLAHDCIDLLSLEWLIPGDVNLHSAILEPSQKRPERIARDHIIYYPNEIYEIESLVQLILEYLDKDQVYVHRTEKGVKIHSVLQKNSNRSGSHHAEMPKLHHALGLSNLAGKNSLDILLDDTLEVTIGENGQFPSLTAMRDALLTYELTTLCVTFQNEQFYLKNQGKFHPITGKGATNGTVALLPKRLFDKDFWEIKVYSDQHQVIVHTTPDGTLDVQAALKTLLNLPVNLLERHNDELIIKLKPRDLIAKLRQTAIFYEGLNVVTEEGKFFLAERIGKGLATPGGHHGEKYSKKNVAYALQSEVGLRFKNPERLQEVVVQLKGIKTISKTGIYIIPANELNSLTPKLFTADNDEFVKDSETILTLTEMRGKKFYDVMPLSELCQYQLDQLQEFIKMKFPECYAYLTMTINKEVQVESGKYKIPSINFGRISITVSQGLHIDFINTLIEYRNSCLISNNSQITFETDTSPLQLIKLIQESLIMQPKTEAPILLTMTSESSLPSPTEIRFQQLKTAVAQGKRDEVEKILHTHPNLLLKKSEEIDSPLQMAASGLNWHMWAVMLKYLPKEKYQEAGAQLQELETRDRECGPHYDATPLITALKNYIERYNALDFDNCITREKATREKDAELTQLWCKGVGHAQRLMPIALVLEICREDHLLHPTPNYKTDSAPPLDTTAKFYIWEEGYVSWFSLPAGLGDTFGLIRAIPPCFGGGWPPEVAKRPLASHAEFNLMAITAWYEAGKEKLRDLKQILQNPNLPEEVSPSRMPTYGP